MTTAADRHFVGLPAFSRDGNKLGKVKDVLQSGESANFVVIGGVFSQRLVVPTDVIEERGDAVVVPFTSSYLDMAPLVNAKKPISSDERDRLRDYFHTRVS
jgi:ribosomal 30S subunit maturation factor RimM